VLARIGQAEIDEAAKKLKPGRGAGHPQPPHLHAAAAVLHHAARKKWCDKPVIARPSQPRAGCAGSRFEEAEQLIAAPPRRTFGRW
jgi:hypothetical protein